MYTESKDRVMSTFSKFKITFDFFFFSFTTAAAYGEGKKLPCADGNRQKPISY
jgi:hypothetical protein